MRPRVTVRVDTSVKPWGNTATVIGMADFGAPLWRILALRDGNAPLRSLVVLRRVARTMPGHEEEVAHMQTAWTARVTELRMES